MMTAFARTVILYFLIMIGLRLMGKRQIGELEPGELVLTMMISDLATVPMQDFGIPLLAGVIPILTLLALSMLLSQLSLTSLRFRRLACGAPSVLIREGVLQQENSGQLSVLPWARRQPPSAEDLGVTAGEEATLPVILVNDGRLLRRNLRAQGLDETWLREALRREGLASHREAFLLTVDERGAVTCVKKERPFS